MRKSRRYAASNIGADVQDRLSRNLVRRGNDDPRWQKWINKGLSTARITKFYEDCEEIGIETGALFMFDFPEQTEDELQSDIKFAMDLPTAFSAFQCLAIFPGSMLTNFYNDNPGLCFQIRDDVALALTRGMSAKEMIEREQKKDKQRNQKQQTGLRGVTA